MIKINNKIKNLSPLPSEIKRQPELNHQKSDSAPDKIIFTSIHLYNKWKTEEVTLIAKIYLPSSFLNNRKGGCLVINNFEPEDINLAGQPGIAALNSFD